MAVIDSQETRRGYFNWIGDCFNWIYDVVTGDVHKNAVEDHSMQRRADTVTQAQINYIISELTSNYYWSLSNTQQSTFITNLVTSLLCTSNVYAPSLVTSSVKTQLANAIQDSPTTNYFTNQVNSISASTCMQSLYLGTTTALTTAAPTTTTTTTAAPTTTTTTTAAPTTTTTTTAAPTTTTTTTAAPTTTTTTTAAPTTTTTTTAAPTTTTTTTAAPTTTTTTTAAPTTTTTTAAPTTTTTTAAPTTTTTTTAAPTTTTTTTAAPTTTTTTTAAPTTTTTTADPTTTTTTTAAPTTTTTTAAPTTTTTTTAAPTTTTATTTTTTSTSSSIQSVFSSQAASTSSSSSWITMTAAIVGAFVGVAAISVFAVCWFRKQREAGRMGGAVAAAYRAGNGLRGNLPDNNVGDLPGDDRGGGNWNKDLYSVSADETFVPVAVDDEGGVYAVIQERGQEEEEPNGFYEVPEHNPLYDRGKLAYAAPDQNLHQPPRANGHAVYDVAVPGESNVDVQPIEEIDDNFYAFADDIYGQSANPATSETNGGYLNVGEEPDYEFADDLYGQAPVRQEDGLPGRVLPEEV